MQHHTTSIQSHHSTAHHGKAITSSLHVPTKTMPRARAARETSVMSAPSVLAATGTRISISSSRWDPYNSGVWQYSSKDKDENEHFAEVIDTINASDRSMVLEFHNTQTKSYFSLM